ncbi:hypothetical protein EIP86_004594 [Pleurotus ostreatoroseus]|nr:hypothetical protein EIP86_004594 [Pleurotus ostreatoroseus]
MTTVTFFSIITTIVLFKGLSAPASQIITLVMGFLVICVGITILQLSKIDPTQLKIPGLDRRSTMLLQAARANTEGVDEKNLAALEDPGIDTLRGSFGTMGSIIRARTARRMSMNSQATVGSLRARHGHHANPSDEQPHYNAMGGPVDRLSGMKRHQLYDPPMPGSDDISLKSQDSLVGDATPRKTTIKFGEQDTVHTYPAGRNSSQQATHEQRSALRSNEHAPGLYPFNARDASSSELNLTLDTDVPRTAPLPSDPHRPPLVDPFAGSPSTASLTSFPSYSTTSDQSTHRKSKGHHIPLFGRSSSGKDYPRGDKAVDREESESLWHRPESATDSASEAEDNDMPPQASVRLVSSPPPRL